MHHHTPTLTDKDVLRHARSRLQRHLPLQADGYLCTTDDLLHVLLAVAVNRTTIEAVCADLLGTPDPETIRGYLNSQLRVEDLSALEGHLNAALADAIPAHVWTQARDVAIDFHDRPSYGKASQDEDLWVRGEAKDGTTRFSRVATAYLMLNTVRITLALRFVVPEDDTVAVLEHLLGRLERLNLRAKRLFLDKGLYWHSSAEVSERARAASGDRLSDPWQEGRDTSLVPGEEQLSHELHFQGRQCRGLHSGGGGLPNGDEFEANASDGAARDLAAVHCGRQF